MISAWRSQNNVIPRRVRVVVDVVLVPALNSAASKAISFGPAPRMLKHRGEHRLSDYFILPRAGTIAL
jgi:hypothetical protein